MTARVTGVGTRTIAELFDRVNVDRVTV